MSDRRVAIVTGAGSGIGRAIAVRLAEDGFRVVVLDLDHRRRPPSPESSPIAGSRRMPSAASTCRTAAQVDAAVERVRTEVGPPLVLVNNAGIPGFKDFMEITDEKWDRIMAVNLNGPFYFCQAVVPDMIAAGWGRIVNISSSSAQSGQPYMVHYVTSKAGLIGFTKALALELGPTGITVNTIPPASSTPRCSEGRRSGASSVGRWTKTAERTPVRRAGHAGGHRPRLLLPRLRRGRLRHRPGDRGERRPQHLRQ